jgi:SulP family sulfate permease
MGVELRFNRQELSGSLGDLGTLLPIAIGLILINGLSATPIFLLVGVFYILSGLYFRCTVPVQPMKVIGAYAIAMSLSPMQISVSGFWMGVFLLLLAVTGAISLVGKYVPKPTVRGVQLTTGILLLTQGVRFMLGDTALQKAHGAAEPFLSFSSIGPVPIGILLGLVSVVLILMLLENQVIPAALVVIGLGLVTGLALGGYRGLSGIGIGLHLPEVLPLGWPTASEAVLALTVLALPQLPMTIGNAVIAQADLTSEYFGKEVARRSTFRALAISMGLINLAGSFLGGMPLCHGAGGLAAHYRFGARTAGSNLMIGSIFLGIGLLFGDQAARLVAILPLSVLGALLVFAGAQLALTILDVKERKDLFVTLSMLGIALATNLAIGFAVGFVLAYLLRTKWINV